MTEEQMNKIVDDFFGVSLRDFHLYLVNTHRAKPVEDRDKRYVDIDIKDVEKDEPELASSWKKIDALMTAVKTGSYIGTPVFDNYGTQHLITAFILLISNIEYYRQGDSFIYFPHFNSTYLENQKCVISDEVRSKIDTSNEYVFYENYMLGVCLSVANAIFKYSQKDRVYFTEVKAAIGVIMRYVNENYSWINRCMDCANDVSLCQPFIDSIPNGYYDEIDENVEKCIDRAIKSAVVRNAVAKVHLVNYMEGKYLRSLKEKKENDEWVKGTTILASMA